MPVIIQNARIQHHQLAGYLSRIASGIMPKPDKRLAPSLEPNDQAEY